MENKQSTCRTWQTHHAHKATAHIYAYHDDDGPVLVVEGLVAGERGDDGEPLLRQEVALALEQPGPVRPTVLQPAKSYRVKIHKPCHEQSNQITVSAGSLGLTKRKIPVLFFQICPYCSILSGLISYATKRRERLTRTKQKQERKTKKKVLDDPVLVLSGKVSMYVHIYQRHFVLRSTQEPQDYADDTGGH